MRHIEITEGEFKGIICEIEHIEISSDNNFSLNVEYKIVSENFPKNSIKKFEKKLAEIFTSLIEHMITQK